MIRQITCINDDNISLSFGSNFAPFLLEDADGLYSFNANVNVSQKSNGDGVTLLGSNLAQRNIVLTLRDIDEHMKHRNVLYQLFKPKSKGTLIYREITKDEDCTRLIDYTVESVNIGSSKYSTASTISLICDDPLFRDDHETLVVMTGWNNTFEFPHEFKEEGKEFATQKKEKIVRIQEDYTISNIGMNIIIDAEDAVTNPKMLRVEDNRYIQVGNDLKPFNMVYGDKLIISTENNNKNVWLIRDGVKTSVNEYIEEGSSYIQLKNGNNTFRYFAQSGEDNMLVSIKYVKKYLGV